MDDDGGNETNSSCGQIMAYINDPNVTHSLHVECYDVRLPCDYKGEIPPHILVKNIPKAEYIVLEHGPFNYEQENYSVEEQMENAMVAFDFSSTGYHFDTSPNRIMCLYHDQERFWKYVRPICK